MSDGIFQTVTAPMDEQWKGVCLDDGTGRNVYFVDLNGVRTRKEPENYVPEIFENGDRRYYYRGSCIRCRKKSPSVFITKNVGLEGYSLNFCEECILQTTQPEFSKIRGRGNEIWNSNSDTPKSTYLDLNRIATRSNRDAELILRGKTASFAVKTQGKLRRNSERMDIIKSQAADYGVFQGSLVSWGFGTAFDEYFGTLDELGRPSGMGVCFYSDGTVYCGEWLEGLRHAAARGVWMRPDESQYEGSWVAGLKHGKGTQTFPGGSVYKGEFAKGYEHGHGIRTYPDGSRFEGRHRFGKRDGPGQLTNPEGHSVRKNFKESEVFHEKPIPDVNEDQVDEEDDGSKNFFEPRSLLSIGVSAVAKAMLLHRHLLPTALVHARLSDYMKPLVAREFLEIIRPLGDKAFKHLCPTVAFRSLDTVRFSSIKFINRDMDSLLYFLSANHALTALSLTYNNLDPMSLDMVSRRLGAKTWPRLACVDLSFNKMDLTGLQNLLNGLEVNPSVLTVKLAGCKINANGAHIISKYLTKNSFLQELDLAFNALQTAGAESLAEAIELSKSLRLLNLRSNNIGSVGGQALVNAVRHCPTLRVLCLADNKAGVEVIAQLSALLKGSILDVCRSVRHLELDIPAYHRDRDADKLEDH